MITKLSKEDRQEATCILLSWLSVRNYTDDLKELLDFLPIFLKEDPFSYENTSNFLKENGCYHLEVRFAEGYGFGTVIVDFDTNLIEEKHSEFPEDDKTYIFEDLQHLKEFFANFEI